MGRAGGRATGGQAHGGKGLPRTHEWRVQVNTGGIGFNSYERGTRELTLAFESNGIEPPRDWRFRVAAPGEWRQAITKNERTGCSGQRESVGIVLSLNGLGRELTFRPVGGVFGDGAGWPQAEIQGEGGEGFVALPRLLVEGMVEG